MKKSLRFAQNIILVQTAAAFLLRLAYLLNSHPFVDEFTTVLAARSILERGVPVLPSGLFYEHGLLFSYLDAPFVGLAGDRMLFILARLPSLLIGTATVPLLYWIGRRWISERAGLVAAALLAFSPEGMVWGGRARMYALAQLLVLLLAFLVYEGSRGEGRPRLRWLALLVLLVTLLTQFGAMLLVPPLVLGGLVVAWLTRPDGARPWFLRAAALAEGATLTVVVGMGVLVKRLGQPLGAAPLGEGDGGNLLSELVNTVTYQGGLVIDGSSAVKFLARQFGVPHHLWLAGVAVVGALVGLILWLLSRSGRYESDGGQFSKYSLLPTFPQRGPMGYSQLYLWLAFGLSVIEMVTLLEPWRRNPRYLVMALPLFYLIVAGGVEQFASLFSLRRVDEAANQRISRPQISYLASLVPVIFIAVQAWFLIPDLLIDYRTPEPAYEEAFQYVAEEWQPGDILLTMNISAAGLYLKPSEFPPREAYGFAIQEDATQFLLNATTQPVDRWLGAPWVGTAADLNEALNAHPRVWFVVDTIRLPVYYRGDWLALLKTQMELVWSGDEALVYRTRPDRSPLPTLPSIQVDADLGGIIRLIGYAGDLRQTSLAANSSGETLGYSYLLTLFWSAIAPIPEDYTVFVHVRDSAGTKVAQRDSQPLEGDYPTSQWHVGEMVIDPHLIELPVGLPPGEYQVWVGMYRLETLERVPVGGDTSGENAIVVGSLTIVE